MSTAETTRLHGGRLVSATLKAHGVSYLFTLSGGHLFSIYDGCHNDGIAIVDTRHEQTATFAAEGWAKATRQPGVAALTAGPGVTNGMSALASAQQNGTPMLVLGGRAPAMRWGQGSLQEIDHVPFVSPVTKMAATAGSPDEIPALVEKALRVALHAPTGPVFVDFPLDHVFSEGTLPDGDRAPLEDVSALPVADGVERAADLLRGAERPVVMAGTGLYWAHGEHALRALAEELAIPVFLNGLARGCVPADHERFFSRARSHALKQADVALVIGVPMDFRLGFGRSFGDDTQIVVIGSAPPEKESARTPAVELYGGVAATLDALRDAAADVPAARASWLTDLRAVENEKRVAEQAELDDERAPLHPMRVYRELQQVLDRGAIVIGDGGDFVSYAGRVIDSYEPARHVDGPGPLRLPWDGAGLCNRGEAGAAGPPGLPAARRRRVRLRRPRVRHDGPPPDPRRRGDGQQRHLGAREAPDGVPLRLLRRGRAAARVPLRPGGRGARRPWRVRHASGRVEAGPGARICFRKAGVGKRLDRSVSRVPAEVELGLRKPSSATAWCASPIGGLAKCSMADGDKPRVRSRNRVGPVVPSDSSRYIGSGE